MWGLHPKGSESAWQEILLLCCSHLYILIGKSPLSSVTRHVFINKKDTLSVISLSDEHTQKRSSFIIGYNYRKYWKQIAVCAFCAVRERNTNEVEYYNGAFWGYATSGNFIWRLTDGGSVWDTVEPPIGVSVAVHILFSRHIFINGQYKYRKYWKQIAVCAFNQPPPFIQEERSQCLT